MTPDMKETWTESAWFSKAILICYITIGVMASLDVITGSIDVWPTAVIAYGLALYKWDSMRDRLEIRRWRYLANCSTTINVASTDTMEAFRKAQQIADLRKMTHDGR